MVQLRLPGWTDAPVRCHRRLRSGDVCVFLYGRWFNYGYQDGQTPPSGVTDGCDPATYVCFFMIDGSVARVPNASILDVSAWEYSVGSTWTTTFSSRVPVLAATYAGSATNT